MASASSGITFAFQLVRNWKGTYLPFFEPITYNPAQRTMLTSSWLTLHRTATLRGRVIGSKEEFG